MALKCNMSDSRLSEDFNRQSKNLYEMMFDAFDRAGLDFIVNARGQIQDHAMGTYKDQTTNLRNSIDYMVFYNGELVSGSKGEFIESNLGKVKELVKNKGFQLIGIAGMNYASHVESKGYNVISYQADICLIDLTIYLENLKLVKEGSAARAEESFIPEELPQNFTVNG